MSDIFRPTTHEGEPIGGPRVRALDYIGGETGFCEPLVVTDGDERHYVLHQAHLDSASESGMAHRKVTFDSQVGLTDSFDEVRRRLTVDPKLDWEETDIGLGLNIPVEEIIAASREIRLIPWDERSPKTDS